MEKGVVATRVLDFIKKGESEKNTLTVKILQPYELVSGQVDFPFAPGTSACAVQFEGLGTDRFDHVIYGADLLQALQLAVNVEPTLLRINREFELYFQTGERYFE